MRFVSNFPYGRAPFWLLVIAVVSLGLRVATARRHEARPDSSHRHPHRGPVRRLSQGHPALRARARGQGPVAVCQLGFLAGTPAERHPGRHRGARSGRGVGGSLGLLHPRPGGRFWAAGPDRSAAHRRTGSAPGAIAPQSVVDARSRLRLAPRRPSRDAGVPARSGRSAWHRREQAGYLGQVRGGRAAGEPRSRRRRDRRSLHAGYALRRELGACRF